MLGKKKKYFADVDVSDCLSSETVDRIIKGQREIEKAMLTGDLNTVLHSDEQLSLFEATPKSVKIHNGSFACGDQSFSTGDVTNNSGVIGQINAPTTIGSASALSNQENDLLRIYRESDGKTQMKIMQFIYELEKEV